MSAEVTLTEAEREALDIAVIDDRDRQEGYAVLGPGGTDGQTPTLHEAVERIVAARVEQARVDERERIAQAIEATYLGPDSGRGYDGSEAPDAHCRNAYDEGLYDAARIAREAGPR